MSTVKSYEQHPYATELEVWIAHRGDDDRGHYVVLNDTVLFPEGGGQPADHGWLDGAAIIDVQHADGGIHHYLDAPFEGDGAHLLTLDWARRFDHMQQHTAQHLITAVAADRFDWPTTAFHLGAERADIEVATESISDERLRELEDAVNDEVRRAHSVQGRRVSAAEYADLEVRSRGLPQGHEGDIRLVEIEGLDRNTCGGTHLANTAEIQSVVLLDTEAMRGGTRIYWLAGNRARHQLHAHRRRAAEVRRLFETSDEELLEVASGKLDKLKATERGIKKLRSTLAETEAGRLSTQAGGLLEAHFDDADAGFLNLILRELTACSEQRPVLLTASLDNAHFFLLGRPDRGGDDLRPLGARVAELLEGRGGGSPDLVQGKADSLARRPEALAFLLQEIDACE